MPCRARQGTRGQPLAPRLSFGSVTICSSSVTPFAPDWRDNAELHKVWSDRINHRSLLADDRIACAMEASGSSAARVSLLVRIESSKACNTPFRFCWLFREALNSSSERTTTYSCPGGATALTPPVRRPVASADLVNFAGSGFISVATALLAKRFCTGSGVSSTTAALGLPG
jgi:hypothetical protein